MELFHNKEPVVGIYVTDVERRIIINALKRMRDDQIRQNKNYDFIETIINKSAMADVVKKKGRRYETR